MRGLRLSGPLSGTTLKIHTGRNYLIYQSHIRYSLWGIRTEATFILSVVFFDAISNSEGTNVDHRGGYEQR